MRGTRICDSKPTYSEDTINFIPGYVSSLNTSAWHARAGLLALHACPQHSPPTGQIEPAPQHELHSSSRQVSQKVYLDRYQIL